MSLRRKSPLIIGTVLISMFLVNYVVEIPTLKGVEDELVSWVTIISSFAIGLGFVNLLIVNIRRIRKEVGFSRRLGRASTLISGVGLAAVGLLLSPSASTYKFWFNAANVPLGMATWAFLAFYVFSATYRAMVGKTFESFLFLITVFFVVMGAIPVGELIWQGFPAINAWIQNIPTGGGYRALTMTMGIGIVAFGLRVLLWREKRVYGLAGDE